MDLSITDQTAPLTYSPIYLPPIDYTIIMPKPKEQFSFSVKDLKFSIWFFDGTNIKVDGNKIDVQTTQGCVINAPETSFNFFPDKKIIMSKPKEFSFTVHRVEAETNLKFTIWFVDGTDIQVDGNTINLETRQKCQVNLQATSFEFFPDGNNDDDDNETSHKKTQDEESED